MIKFKIFMSNALQCLMSILKLLPPLTITTIYLIGFWWFFKNIGQFDYGKIDTINFLNAWLAFLSLLLAAIGALGAFYVFNINGRLKELDDAEKKVDVAILIGEASQKLVRGDFIKAKKDYLKILELAPHREATAYSGIGAAYYGLENYSMAKYYFQKAIKIKLNLSNAIDISDSYNKLGDITFIESNGKLSYHLAIEYAKAIELYTEAISLDPDNSSAYLNRAIARYKLFGATDKLFKKDLEETKKINPYIAKNMINNDDKYNIFNEPIEDEDNIDEYYKYDTDKEGLYNEALKGLKEADEKDDDVKDMIKQIKKLIN